MVSDRRNCHNKFSTSHNICICSSQQMNPTNPIINILLRAGSAVANFRLFFFRIKNCVKMSCSNYIYLLVSRFYVAFLSVYWYLYNHWLDIYVCVWVLLTDTLTIEVCKCGKCLLMGTVGFELSKDSVFPCKGYSSNKSNNSSS